MGTSPTFPEGLDELDGFGQVGRVDGVLASRFTLDGDNLVTCLQNSPSCAAMFFEYAKEFTAAVKKSLGFKCSHGEH